MSKPWFKMKGNVMVRNHGIINENDEETKDNDGKMINTEKNKPEHNVDSKVLQEFTNKLGAIEVNIDNINTQLENNSTFTDDLDKHYQEILSRICTEAKHVSTIKSDLDKYYQQIKQINTNIAYMSGIHTYINRIYANLEELKNQVSKQENL